MTEDPAENDHEAAPPSPEREGANSFRGGLVLLGFTGLAFVLQGISSVYRALATDSFESGVAHLGGSTGSQLAAENPELAAYVSHLQANGGALAALVGLAVLVLVWYGVREGKRWAWGTAVALPLAYVAVLVPLHLASGFHYATLEHLGPVLVGTPILLAGAVLAYRGLPESGTVSKRPTQEGAR